MLTIHLLPNDKTAEIKVWRPLGEGGCGVIVSLALLRSQHTSDRARSRSRSGGTNRAAPAQGGLGGLVALSSLGS
jgi:hypothetical protein